MMKTGLIQNDIRVESVVVEVQNVNVRERIRPVDPEFVSKLVKSFTDLGGQLQLQPILLNEQHVLIDGGHRLAAAKQAGWTHIRAEIHYGLAEDEQRLLELEANIVRREMSVVEIEEAWRTHYEPVYKARAKENQVSHLLQGDESPVIRNSNNGENASSVSLATAARTVTGRSLDTLNKVTDIRAVAMSETAPTELRNAAQRGLVQLAKPGASVDQVHKKLLRLQDQQRAAGEGADVRRARELEIRLDQTLTDTSLLAERLGGELGETLLAAATGRLGAESLRSIRVSLTHALASVVVLECRLDEDPGGRLQLIGREATKMLTDRSVGAVQQAVGNGQD